MSTKERRLSAKVNAVNRVHRHMMELHPKLAAVFAPFVGQQILKVDGRTLLAKVQSKMPELPNNTGSILVYRRASDAYGLSFGVKASEMDSDHTCLYYEGVLCIGAIQGAMLIKLTPAPVLRTDFTEEEITAKREALDAARKAASAAESALIPFGDSDR